MTDYVGIVFHGITVGDYSNNNSIEVIGSLSNDWWMANQSFTSLEVTEYGTNVVGTFSGVMENA